MALGPSSCFGYGSDVDLSLAELGNWYGISKGRDYFATSCLVVSRRGLGVAVSTPSRWRLQCNRFGIPMSVKVGLGVQATMFLVNPTTGTRKKGVYRHHRRAQYPHGRMVKMLIGIRCEYPPKPPEFTVDYDPFEDFFGLGIDMKTRKQVQSSDNSRSSYGAFEREVPCPVCRGRGYIPETPEGPSICTHCIGKGMVLEDSVRESAWETAQTRSVLKVEDDEVLDNVDPEVRKPTGRVYGPRSEDVRLKISRTLKELEKRTGAISKRVKKQHQDAAIHAQMVAAIKRAKNTELSKKKVSEKQKLFFQNPENRRMRGLQMKGVKFFCKHCGKEGHRRHFCPELGYVKKVSVKNPHLVRCGLCKQPGHRRTTCPNKDLHFEEEVKPQKRSYKPRAKGLTRGIYKCGCCQQHGHTRRSCPELQSGKT